MSEALNEINKLFNKISMIANGQRMKFNVEALFEDNNDRLRVDWNKK